LEPSRFQCGGRYTPQTVYDVATTESDKALLYFRLFIRITGVIKRVLIENGIWVLVKENQRCIQESLKKKIVVDPFGEVAPTPNVAGSRIKNIIAPGRYSILNLQPFAKTGQKIITGSRRAIALFEMPGKIRNRLPQELRNVGTLIIS